MNRWCRNSRNTLQLAGYALVFLGLGVAAAALFAAGSYPTVPMWAFAAGAIVLGAPPMIAGGRLNSRGRAIVLEIPPERAANEYRVQTILVGLYVGFLWLHGGVVAAPVFVRATGLIHPSDAFISVWAVASMLILCAGREWITRLIWRAIERRVLTRRGRSGAVGGTDPRLLAGANGSGATDRSARVSGGPVEGLKPCPKRVSGDPE